MSAISEACPPDTLRPVPLPSSLRLYLSLVRADVVSALNCDGEADGATGNIAAQMKWVLNRVSAEMIDTNGRVNYSVLRESRLFAEYMTLVRALRHFDPHTLTTREMRLAFWINLYNALIIHTVIALNTRERITESGGMGVFSRAAYIVGGLRYSADDIEHGILRANAGLPFLPGEHFVREDPRRVLALDTLDPRIHFALNCAAASCPPIAFYEPENIDAQLEMAARSFINGGGAVIDRVTRTVSLSRIFSWYASDFGAGSFGLWKQSALLRFIARYIDSAGDVALLNGSAGRARIRWLKYDWSLNTNG